MTAYEKCQLAEIYLQLKKQLLGKKEQKLYSIIFCDLIHVLFLSPFPKAFFSLVHYS